MPSRRTKQDKLKARHNFTISWEPSTSKLKSAPGVNRQFQNTQRLASNEPENSKLAKISAKEIDLAIIKKNMFASLLFAALILGIELVLYFIWNVK